MQLSRPLDFVAITDHAEGFGLRTRCGEPDLTLVEELNCWVMETPGFTTALFFASRQSRMVTGTEPNHSAGTYRNRPRGGRLLGEVPICTRGEGGPEDVDTTADEMFAISAQLASISATLKRLQTR